MRAWLSLALGGALGACVGLGVYDGVVVASRGIDGLEALRVASMTFGFIAMLLVIPTVVLAIVLAGAFGQQSPRALVRETTRRVTAPHVVGGAVGLALLAGSTLLIVDPLHGLIVEPSLRHVVVVVVSLALVPVAVVLGAVGGELASSLSVQEASALVLLAGLLGLATLTGSLGELSSLGPDATVAPMLVLVFGGAAGLAGLFAGRWARRVGIWLWILAVPLALAPVDEEVLAVVTFEAPMGGRLSALNPWAEDDFDALGDLDAPPAEGAKHFRLTKDTSLREQWPVIVIAVDSLRPDHLHCYGYDRETSPNIDRLAERSVRFEWAYAQASSTHYSVPSLMTSRYMSELALDGRNIERKNTTLAELLREAGYHTVGLSAPKIKGIGRGIEQGFVKWHNFWRKKPRDERITERAIRILRKNREKPLFMWIHYYSPHGSYVSHEEAPPWGKRKRDRYDQEIWWTDQQFGRLLDTIDEVYGPDGAIVILTADHGEALGEHDRFGHAKTLYEELVRVPLIVRVPGAEPGVSSGLVSLLDVMPTVLDVTGTSFKGRVQGQSLVPLLEGEPPDEERMVFQELRFGRADTKGQFGVRYRDFHAILDVRSGSMRLYDIVEDPEETKDLSRSAEHEDVASTMRAAAIAQQRRAATKENVP